MHRHHEKLTEEIVGAAIEVHRALGPGLLEAAYAACLTRELVLRGHAVQREVAAPLDYKGVHVAAAYHLDILVDDVVVLEIKAVERLLPVHQAQLVTYLRLTGHEVGLLLNFNVPSLRQGIRRCFLPGSRDPGPV